MSIIATDMARKANVLFCMIRADGFTPRES